MSLLDSDPAGHLVLVNDAGEYSLWPASIAPPPGWRVVHGPDQRESCLEYVDERWT
jgi:MbtH protein